jgi:hypothetical protein
VSNKIALSAYEFADSSPNTKKELKPISLNKRLT